jgi:hypothetical protein
MLPVFGNKMARFASLLVLISCAKAIPEVDVSAVEPRVVLLPQVYEPFAVRAAIIGALQDRGWTSDVENGQEIEARLNNKGSLVRVGMSYDQTRVVIKALEAKANQRNYDKWIANLEASIRSALNKPVPVVAPVAAPVAPATPAPVLAIFERNQTPDGGKAAIAKGLAAHSWVLEADEPAGLLARLNHRKGMVRIRITFNAQQASIVYVDSKELSFDATGRSDEYERWMRLLVDAIRANSK